PRSTLFPYTTLFRSDVGGRKLPVLGGLFETAQKAPFLFLLRQIEKELPDDDAIAPQVMLVRVDIGEAFIPDVRGDERRRRPFALEQLLVHAHDENLFVVGAVEDADSAALGDALGGPPEEVVIEFFGRRLLERINLASLRIDAGHHVLD